jgi:hypothetical protein
MNRKLSATPKMTRLENFAEPFHLIWVWTFKPRLCGRIFSQLFLGWRAGVRGGVASGAKVFGKRAVRDRYGIFYIISSFE